METSRIQQPAKELIGYLNETPALSHPELISRQRHGLWNILLSLPSETICGASVTWPLGLHRGHIGHSIIPICYSFSFESTGFLREGAGEDKGTLSTNTLHVFLTPRCTPFVKHMRTSYFPITVHLLQYYYFVMINCRLFQLWVLPLLQGQYTFIYTTPTNPCTYISSLN